MEYIWAPWRVEFIEMPKPQGCFLCDKPKENNDARNYILFRGKLNYVVLNAYPYNPAHLLIAPYRHVATIEGFTKEELVEHFEIVKCCTSLLRQIYNPGGFNMGMNLGKIAGAGVDDHAHSHIVPRWQGDANFMPVVADTKVLPEALDKTYRKLINRFQNLLG